MWVRIKVLGFGAVLGTVGLLMFTAFLSSGYPHGLILARNVAIAYLWITVTAYGILTSVLSARFRWQSALVRGMDIGFLLGLVLSCGSFIYEVHLATR